MEENRKLGMITWGPQWNIVKLGNKWGPHTKNEDGVYEPHRHSDVAWFDLNDLPETITEHALLAIESIKSNTRYFENGW